jgi:hypothetical protein
MSLRHSVKASMSQPSNHSTFIATNLQQIPRRLLPHPAMSDRASLSMWSLRRLSIARTYSDRCKTLLDLIENLSKLIIDGLLS